VDPEGWLYLAVMLDLFSRRVVGWSVSERLERGLALDALRMALKDRRPPQGLLHHSDRGSQYASHEYQALLAIQASRKKLEIPRRFPTSRVDSPTWERIELFTVSLQGSPILPKSRSPVWDSVGQLSDLVCPSA